MLEWRSTRLVPQQMRHRRQAEPGAISTTIKFFAINSILALRHGPSQR